LRDVDTETGSPGKLSVDRAPQGPLAKVEVFDNQIEAALKTLKKQMLKAGLFQEMKRRVAYEKPSVKRKQAAARKKRRKAMRRMEGDRE